MPTADHAGYVRYNTQTSQFEGFGAGDSWGSLGGVMDVDQDTFIKAENTANADNDELWFVTNGNRRMTIKSDGNINVASDMTVNGTMAVVTTTLVHVERDGDLTTNGKIGIGTNSPAEALQIDEGTMKITGTTAPGNAINDGATYGIIVVRLH